MFNIFSRDTLATLCLETVPASLKVQYYIIIMANFPSGEEPENYLYKQRQQSKFQVGTGLKS